MAAEHTGAARTDHVDPVSRSEAPGDRRQGQSDRRRQSRPDEPSRRAARPYAPLVAQLIATALGLAQTRSRRRAAAAEAIALYEGKRQDPGRSHGLV